ncbi:hypothetical protein BDF22DRAFT_652597 [Syncephalis plumigaleata]|nr:hypothetical protein BDF22DRAFT_652597 [Syncephalis plumigaleata]
MWYSRLLVYVLFFTVSPVLALALTSSTSSIHPHDQQRNALDSTRRKEAATTAHLERRNILSRLAKQPRDSYNRMIDKMLESIRGPLYKEVNDVLAFDGVQFAQYLPKQIEGIFVEALTAKPVNTAPNTKQGNTRLQRRQPESMPGAFPTTSFNDKAANNGLTTNTPTANKPSGNIPSSQSDLSEPSEVLQKMPGAFPIDSKISVTSKRLQVKSSSSSSSSSSTSDVLPAVKIANLDQGEDADTLNAIDAEMNGQTSSANTATTSSTRISPTPPALPLKRHARRASIPLPSFSLSKNRDRIADKLASWRNAISGVKKRSTTKICTFLEKENNVIVAHSIRSGMDDIFPSIYNSIVAAFKFITTCLGIPEVPLIKQLANQAIQTGTTAIMWPGQKVAEWRRKQLGLSVNPAYAQSIKQEVSKTPDVCSSIGMQLAQQQQFIKQKIYEAVDPFTRYIIKLIQYS